MYLFFYWDVCLWCACAIYDSINNCHHVTLVHMYLQILCCNVDSAWLAQFPFVVMWPVVVWQYFRYAVRWVNLMFGSKWTSLRIALQATMPHLVAIVQNPCLVQPRISWAMCHQVDPIWPKLLHSICTVWFYVMSLSLISLFVQKWTAIVVDWRWRQFFASFANFWSPTTTAEWR